ESLLDSVMGDRALLSEMAGLWLTDSVKQVKQIESGLESGDATMIQGAAHALKGSVGTFQASDAQEAAKELEISARDGDMVRARKVFQKLLKHIDLLSQDLRRLSRDER
ncbi:MAG TPA: Hpt domain-containing protein, partial [Terriglobales bacterium]|nr:Hpt domain-containing protein [Terriglobales bacterium]